MKCKIVDENWKLKLKRGERKEVSLVEKELKKFFYAFEKWGKKGGFMGRNFTAHVPVFFGLNVPE